MTISKTDQALADKLAHQAILKMCREDFYFFVRYAFKKTKKYNWLRNWHHEVICRKLEAVYRGETKRLIINLPPRYSKTQLAVVYFIAWTMGKEPDSEFIHCSYAQTVATKNSEAIRNLLEEEWYQEIFPKVTLRNDSKAKDKWTTTEGGSMLATGNDGSITSFGAGKIRKGFGGAIVIDDPIKPKSASAKSGVGITSVNDWFNETLKSRANDPKTTPIIVIMQRLHENDLSGFLLNGGDGDEWEHLMIPVLDATDTPLWEEKHDLEMLRKMEAADSYVFAGQYMQRPAPKGGGIFKDQWWQYYSVLPEMQYSFIVADTAMKAKESSDYSVLACWGVCKKGRAYLIDMVRGKWESPELLKSFVAFWNKNKHNSNINLTRAWVEDKASGTGLIQQLKREFTIPVGGIQRGAGQDKVSRAYNVVAYVETGYVHLPKDASFVSDFLSEHSVFPNGSHDDIVDTTTDALDKIFNKTSDFKVRIV